MLYQKISTDIDVENGKSILAPSFVIYLTALFHRPTISEDLKELIILTLDKSPETRITIPEIKVKDERVHVM